MTETPEKHGHSILIVEDEKPMLKALAAKFARNGFTVLTAENGETGLELALQKHPEIILLDIVMPKMDGIAVLKKLRADDYCKNIPVILLTNLADNEKVMQATQNKAYDYLVKADWKIEDVVKKVEEKLNISYG